MQNQAHEHLIASRDGLIYARHPFAGGDEEITIGMYLIERLPERRLALGRALFEVDAQLMTEVYEAGRIVGEQYYSLYLRVLGALAAIAEKVESKAGLPPLPKVEPTEDWRRLSLQSLYKIREQIVRVLESNRKTQQVGRRRS